MAHFRSLYDTIESMLPSVYDRQGVVPLENVIQIIRSVRLNPTTSAAFKPFLTSVGGAKLPMLKYAKDVILCQPNVFWFNGD